MQLSKEALWTSLAMHILTRRTFINLSSGFVLSGCAYLQTHRKVEVPARSVTRIEVAKAARQMDLYLGDLRIKRYRIALGFAPEGHKRYRGDGRTPEGIYRIDRRNPRSAFHLSLGISYPSASEIAVAQKEGRDPGDNIFIHGQPNGREDVLPGDWTAGCIAVTNSEMREIWSLVPLGCQITIRA